MVPRVAIHSPMYGARVITSLLEFVSDAPRLVDFCVNIS